MLLFAADEEFQFSARVSAPLQAVYDVAALVLYDDCRTWAKLCYEMSPDHQATIVSVVTRDSSDDCNSDNVGMDGVYLAIVRRDSEFAFHYSVDGTKWMLVRHFRLAGSGRIRAGFVTHGSTGEGIDGAFSEIRYVNRAPSKMRMLDRPSE